MRFTWQLFSRALFVRRTRSLTAFAAVLVATTVATALLNLYADTQSKLTSEFRGFGANAVVQSDNIDLPSLRAKLEPGESAVPLAFATAQNANGQPIVVVGSEIAELQKTNHFWKIDPLPSHDGTALIGRRVQAHGGWQRVRVGEKEIAISTLGVITTGDADESRIFIPLEQLRSAVPTAHIQVALLALPGDPAKIESRVEQLRTAFPTYHVEIKRQIVTTQASILLRMRAVLLLSTVLIAGIASLSLLASLSASVLERRKDFAVMKALGASQASVSSLFLLEGLAIGLAGAFLGFVLGCGISAWIGYANFHSVVHPRMEVLPWIVATALAITAIGALLPLQRLQKIQPAAMLKGE